MSTIALKVSSSFSVVENLLTKLSNFRVKNHLRLVEQGLRHKDVSHLSELLQQKRADHLDNLHNYWQNGVFPRNTAVSGKRVAIFKDELGTPCAMGYLMEQAGATELVAHVQKNDNFVFIDELSEGAVVDWIAQSGLTKQEAAYIQPTYDFMQPAYIGRDLWQLVAELFVIAMPIIVFVVAEILVFKLTKRLMTSKQTERKLMIAYLTILNIGIAGIIFLSLLLILIEVF